MPEFKSRMDSYNWHTPLFSDIFSLDDVPSSDESMVETNQARLASALARMASSVHLEGARAMPSYTLYEASLEENLADEELREKVYKIEAQEGWVLGYNWQNSQHVQFLLRTEGHHPLALSHVISRITFRKATHPASFVMGVSLQQQILVRDWESLGHLLIVGDGGTKQSFIRSILVTMLMLQTPSELRIAFVGVNSEEYHYIQDTPHVLGVNSHRSPDQGIRLLLGMSKEIVRRQSLFKEMGALTLGACNRHLLENKCAPMPRILLVLDSLGQVEWVKHQAIWMPYLREIIKHGAEVGIHAIVTARSLAFSHPFDELSQEIPSQLITRSAAADTHFIEAVDPFHSSLVRFVDGFFVEDAQIIPVELPAVTAYDAKAAFSYWEKNSKERLHLNQLTGIQQPVSLSSVFSAVENLPNPPIPDKPPAMALVRAAEILAERNGNLNHNSPVYLAVEELKDEAQPGSKRAETKPKYIDVQVDLESLRRAQALATYLGWLGRGPLIDVLGLSVEEADVMIAILQARQILERGSSPTPHLHHRRRRSK
jgi:hypothetical protein